MTFGIGDLYRYVCICCNPGLRRRSRVFSGCDRSAKEKYTGAHVRLECAINLTRILKIDVEKAEALFDSLLETAAIRVMSVDDEISKVAVHAFGRFGKGRGHPAQLNFGDCLSYACASTSGAAILCKGRDFIHSDLEIA